MALDPLTDPSWMLCAYCGAVCLEHSDHQCRSGPVELPGVEFDSHKRAKSYAVE